MFIVFILFMCCYKLYDSMKYFKQKAEIFYLVLPMLNFALIGVTSPQSTMLYESGK